MVVGFDGSRLVPTGSNGCRGTNTNKATKPNTMKTMKPTLVAGLSALALCFQASVAQAWHITGQVWCDANQNGQIDAADTPEAGVRVVIENSDNSFVQVVRTGKDGTFETAVPDTADTYVCYLERHKETILLPPSGMHVIELTDAVQNAHVEFLLECVQPGQPMGECPKLTGGGWIVGPSGAKANFGVQAGIRRGEMWGGLNYIDHGTGMHVKSRTVTSVEFDPTDSDCLLITYDVTIDGEPGEAAVRACDKGEPGRDDIFEIVLSNGYTAGGTLGGDGPGGGNIQLHKCPPGWTE
jgi:hypothetical protein